MILKLLLYLLIILQLVLAAAAAAVSTADKIRCETAMAALDDSLNAATQIAQQIDRSNKSAARWAGRLAERFEKKSITDMEVEFVSDSIKDTGSFIEDLKKELQSTEKYLNDIITNCANNFIFRSSKARRDFMKVQPCPSTGKIRGACPGDVIDHIVPLKRGGADRPENMQWQTKEDARAKDRTE